ncbi:hypothetical protein Tcan_03637 [Toxocara canis]|uniref:Uncharacterized protein n=1 Tax=Toxocara canis TaxID=6265 RepID=A0A0B2VS69_TOXCA|nr:hypothetical protein Tcan_03637 [Toxocara canis]
MLFIAAKVEVNSIRPADLPCLYKWGPWSACSSKCRTSSSSALPFTFRRITKVFNSTGTKYAPCPTGLVKGFKQFAPCNTHICPRKLSSFSWSKCFYRNPNRSNSTDCYQVRDLPLTEAIITIDVVNLERRCVCPEYIE